MPLGLFVEPLRLLCVASRKQCRCSRHGLAGFGQLVLVLLPLGHGRAQSFAHQSIRRARGIRHLLLNGADLLCSGTFFVNSLFE